MHRWCWAVVTFTTLLGCSETNKDPQPDNNSFRRRVFRPPPKGEVRAVPPHNIHSGGVGPYELGASFQETLGHLPQGPRVELYQAKGLFDYRLMRADNDALVIGVGRRGGVAFIAVLDPDIARTESGVGVGAGIQELTVALGEIQPALAGGRDARIIRFSALPNARFILERGKVVAALVVPSSGEAVTLKPEPEPVVTSPKNKAKTETIRETNLPAKSCQANALKERQDEILAVARMPYGKKPDELIYGCLLSELGEAVVRMGNQIWVIGTTAQGSFRLLGTTTVPGLNFVAVLDTGEEWPELYSISQRHDSTVLEVVVTRHPVGNSKVGAGWSGVAFRLDAIDASWIGGSLNTADFLVELNGGNGVVVIGGIFKQELRGVLRHVVPVDVVTLPIERAIKKQPVAVADDAGIRDAGSTDGPKENANENLKAPRQDSGLHLKK